LLYNDKQQYSKIMFNEGKDTLSIWIKRRLGVLSTPTIMPFLGFGNRQKLVLRGRVTEDKGLARPSEDAGVWENVSAMAKRYWSDNLPQAQVRVRTPDEEQVVETDEHGVFTLELSRSASINGSEEWLPISYKLENQLVENQPLVMTQGEALLPNPQAEYGIISDVDDTIIVSHSTKTFRKLRLMLTKNAHTRLPFEGVSDLYHGLSKKGKNPLFFVSSSEWNLYDLLIDFCAHHDIPKAPFLLQRLRSGIKDLVRSGGGNHQHKLDKIREIMTTYPELKFILIGDSGQRDPEIYAEAARAFPGRILAIYIRDISKKPRRAEIQKIANDLSVPNTEMLLVKTTFLAQQHAERNGFL